MSSQPTECCEGSCKTHETVSENGVKWLLCHRHAEEVKALGYLTVRRLAKS